MKLTLAIGFLFLTSCGGEELVQILEKEIEERNAKIERLEEELEDKKDELYEYDLREAELHSELQTYKEALQTHKEALETFRSSTKKQTQAVNQNAGAKTIDYWAALLDKKTMQEVRGILGTPNGTYHDGAEWMWRYKVLEAESGLKKGLSVIFGFRKLHIDTEFVVQFVSMSGSDFWFYVDPNDQQVKSKIVQGGIYIFPTLSRTLFWSKLDR